MLSTMKVGDRSDFGEVWQYCKPYVAGVLRARLKRSSPEDIDDAMQEVALNVWKGWKKFDGTNPEGFVIAVAKNTTVDIIRRHTAVRRTGETVILDSGLPIRDEVVDREYAAVENRDLVTAVLDTLPPRERSLCEMVYIRGITQEAVAERIGMSESSVCRILAHGRQLVKTAVLQALE